MPVNSSLPFLLTFIVFLVPCIALHGHDPGCALRIMFRIYEQDDREEIWDAMERRIEEYCSATFQHFLLSVTRETRDIWTPLIVLILRELLNLSDDRVRMEELRQI